MPNNSVFDDLSPDEIAKIEAEIANRNFKNYSGLSEWCKSHGWSIERGALWNRGSKIKRYQQILKDATASATMIGESVKDDSGVLNDATLSLVQAGIFNVLTKIGDDDTEDQEIKRQQRQLGMLSMAAKASSEVGRASINVKKYKSEVRAKLQAAALKAEPIAKKAGLSDADWSAIRAEFLGVEVATS